MRWLLVLNLILFTSSSFLFVHAADNDDKPPPPNFDFNNLGGMGKVCPPFRCSNNKKQTPVQKIKTKFESSGCSAMGGGMMMSVQPGDDNKPREPYADCCDQWHACYQICGINKQLCDDEFKKCGTQMCFGNDQCKQQVDLNVMMLQLGGCDKFNKAQSEVACDCLNKDNDNVVNKQRELFLKSFYKKNTKNNNNDENTKIKNLIKKSDTTKKFTTLLRKLLIKYPKAIKQIEDPQQAMYRKIMKDAAKNKEKEDNDKKETTTTTTSNDVKEEKEDEDDEEQEVQEL